MVLDPPMSCSAYAKRRNVSKMSVSDAIKNGRLVNSVVRDQFGNPKISDPELADQEWAANTDPMGRYRASGGDPSKLSDPMVPAPQNPGSVPESSLANAAARAKHYDAELKRIKLEEASGDLVRVADVRREWVDLLSSVRTKLLGVPTRLKQQRPHLAVEDVACVEGLIREALEDLVAAESST